MDRCFGVLYIRHSTHPAWRSRCIAGAPSDVRFTKHMRLSFERASWKLHKESCKDTGPHPTQCHALIQKHANTPHY